MDHSLDTSTSSSNANVHSNTSSSSSSSNNSNPHQNLRPDLPLYTDDDVDRLLIDKDPRKDYDFQDFVENDRYVTVASGINIQQSIQHVIPIEVHQQGSVSLYAKTFHIDREFEMQAVILHIRTWYGIDKIDRPGCGKIVKGYIYDEKVPIEKTTYSNSSSSSSSTSLDSTTEVTRKLPRITIIFEGSPNPQIELRTGFDDCYTYFRNQRIGEGGNTGLNDTTARGGIYLGTPIDFSKPLPTIAVKRVDGRDGGQQNKPASINNDKGIHRLNEEINTWASIHYPSPHPRVVRIFDAFLDKTDIPGCNVASIVMECAPPGEITNPSKSPLSVEQEILTAINQNRLPRIPVIPRPSDLVNFISTTKQLLDPVQAVHVMSQVLMTLFHMHNRFPQIIHRDIKGDNIILWDSIRTTNIWTIDETTQEEKKVRHTMDLYLVKLADFGEARILEPDDKAYTNLGTPAYKAPEISRQKAQTPAVDVYSCGITLFTLLIGNAPFDTIRSRGMNQQQWERQLQQGSHGLSNSPHYTQFQQRLQPDMQALIIQMMHPEPEERITIPEIFHHPVFQKYRKYYYKIGNHRVPLVPEFK